MIDLPKRLRASLRCDAINGDSFERSVCAKQMREAADTLDRADTRIAELERECSQWRDELRIYRETENSRIAELEQSVTVRDTEIARLETDLELARRDAERWRKLRAMNWTQKDALAVVHVRDLRLGTLTFTHDRLDLAVDARAGNGGGV